jgi:hypothetical protein
MSNTNQELEIASAKRINYFVNLFYYYLMAKKQSFELKTKNDIIMLFRITNDLAHVNKPQEHEEIKNILDSINDANAKTYYQLSTELKLISVSLDEKDIMQILSRNAFYEMQEKHPEYAIEYTRSIF